MLSTPPPTRCEPTRPHAVSLEACCHRRSAASSALQQQQWLAACCREAPHQLSVRGHTGLLHLQVYQFFSCVVMHNNLLKLGTGPHGLSFFLHSNGLSPPTAGAAALSLLLPLPTRNSASSLLPGKTPPPASVTLTHANTHTYFSAPPFHAPAPHPHLHPSPPRVSALSRCIVESLVKCEVTHEHLRTKTCFYSIRQHHRQRRFC